MHGNSQIAHSDRTSLHLSQTLNLDPPEGGGHFFIQRFVSVFTEKIALSQSDARISVA